MLDKQPIPDVLHGATKRIKTGGCGTLHVTLNNSKDGKPLAVRLSFGKMGGCGAASMQAVQLSITRSLRHGVPLSEIIKDLTGIACHLPSISKVLSCYDGLAKVLAELEPLPPRKDW